MGIVNEDVKEVWTAIYEMGLFTENTPINFEAFQLIMEESQTELQILLNAEIDNDFVKQLDFETLVRLPFNDARKAINMFSMSKRIDFLNKLDCFRKHYYNEASRYGLTVAEGGIQPKVFMSLMSKIKHLEIIQNWLYGLN